MKLLLALLIASVLCPVLADGNPENCSITESRRAREHIAKKLGEEILQSISYSCPFHPLRDVYYVVERKRRPANYGRWQCLLCGKTFIDDEFLDMHLEGKHKEAHVNHKAVCLADYCDILDCNSSSSSDEAADGAIGTEGDADCDAKNKHAQVRCEAVAKSCLISVLRGQELTQQVHRFCEHLQCTGRGKSVLELPQAGVLGPRFVKDRIGSSRSQRNSSTLSSMLVWSLGAAFFAGLVFLALRSIRLRRKSLSAWDSSGTFSKARSQLRAAQSLRKDSSLSEPSEARLDDPPHRFSDTSDITARLGMSSSTPPTSWLKMRGKQSSASDIDI